MGRSSGQTAAGRIIGAIEPLSSHHELTRRQLLAAALAAVPARAAAASPLVDAHIHLFDPKRAAYHPNAPYRPPAQTVESYSAFVRDVGIRHAVIVQPEPYQDDHRYLEYCFAHEPSPNFFKGTCLFDPVFSNTPGRIEALMKKNPGRIVALRIHEVRKKGMPPSYQDPKLPPGPIKERNLQSNAMKNTWRKAHSLGLAIEMHFLPHFAPQIGELAAQFPGITVLLDHLARAGQGTAADFEEVLKLVKFPGVVMKYSGVEYSSKAPYPYMDVQATVQRVFNTFGPDRIICGGLGYTRAEFDKQNKLFDLMFESANPAERAKIRGLNAMKLFKW